MVVRIDIGSLSPVVHRLSSAPKPVHLLGLLGLLGGHKPVQVCPHSLDEALAQLASGVNATLIGVADVNVQCFKAFLLRSGLDVARALTAKKDFRSRLRRYVREVRPARTF